MKRLIRLGIFAVVAMLLVCGAVFGLARPRSTASLPPTNPPHATTVPALVEPSGALGMSRAAWETIAGPPTGKRTGDLYGNGIEATFIDDTIWRVDYWFPKDSPVDPKVAWDQGKVLLPKDAKLIKTYQRDVTTVHVYHSDWLKDRFPATTKIKDTEISNWPEAEPGDFTLQYNVYDGKAPSFIIALGNNP